MRIRKLLKLVLHTPYNFVENQQDYNPLCLVVSGTAARRKSYVIRYLQRLEWQVFGANDSTQVIQGTRQYRSQLLKNTNSLKVFQ